MAGVGSAPKDPGERRRRNIPQRGEWVDLSPIIDPILPALDEIAADIDEWRPATVGTWEAWRIDPVTQTWSPSDIAHAMDTIALHNQMTSSNANEVRLRMDGLGLTPKGKRDLRLRLAVGEDGEVAPRRAPSSASKRRARLSVVK